MGVERKITAVSFTADSIIIGTESGQIIKLDANTGEQQQSFSVLQNEPITSLSHFTGIKDSNIFLATVDHNQLFLIQESSGTCEQIVLGTHTNPEEYAGETISDVHISDNALYFTCALPERSLLVAYNFDRVTLKASPAKEISE